MPKSDNAAPAAVPSAYSRLVPHFAFYGAYHNNAVNQWIHIVFVPVILTTFIAIFHYYLPMDSFVGDAVSKLTYQLTGSNFSFATVALIIYVLFYIYMAPSLLGLSMAALVIGLYFFALKVIIPGGLDSIKIAGAVNVVAWIAQFYGHGVHEKRAPALLDNLMQAFLMAPLFVYIEVLLKFGLLKDLHAATEPEVQRLISQFKAVKSQ